MKRAVLSIAILLLSMLGFADDENANSGMSVNNYPIITNSPIGSMGNDWGIPAGSKPTPPLNAPSTTVPNPGISNSTNIGNPYDIGGFTQIQQVAPVEGSSQTTTMIVEGELRGNQQGEIDSTKIQTETISPSTNPLPAWKQSLVPEATSTTSVQNIERYGDHTEVTSIQQQTTAPSTSNIPLWKQALQPPATTKTITSEKGIETATGDDITTIQSQTIGPVPAWDRARKPSGETSIAEQTRQSGGIATDKTAVEGQLNSPVESR